MWCLLAALRLRLVPCAQVRYIGYFSSPEEAAMAYDAVLLEVRGPGAKVW